jgi:hypothetical protein
VAGLDYLIPATTGTTRNFLTLRGQRTYLTPASRTRLDLLTTAVNGDQQADVTITYTDGSTSTAKLAVTDWAAAGPKFGEDAAITATTRYNVNGTADGRTVRIWHVAVPLDPTRTAASFTTTPNQNIKVLALSTT